METGNQKIYWMDTLKLLAALLVFSTHFLAEYAPKFLVHWERGHILYGITGKLAVSFFFLMSGYFAMKAAREKAWQYMIKRYLRLAVPVLLIETVMLFWMICLKAVNVDAWLSSEITGRYLKLENMNYEMFLSDIFLLGGKVVVTYWGNFMLFAGPVIVMLLHGVCKDKGASAGKWGKGKPVLLFGAAGLIFYLLGYAWYTVCMLGALLYLAMSGEKELNVWTRRVIKALLLVVICFCVRTPETNAGYVMKGAASFGLVFFIFYDKKIQALLENKICRSLSVYSFEIYLVHTPINLMVVSFLFGFLKEAGVPHRVTLACAYLLSLVLTLLCSRGVHAAAGRIVQSVWRRIE